MRGIAASCWPAVQPAGQPTNRQTNKPTPTQPAFSKKQSDNRSFHPSPEERLRRGGFVPLGNFQMVPPFVHEILSYEGLRNTPTSVRVPLGHFSGISSILLASSAPNGVPRPNDRFVHENVSKLAEDLATNTTHLQLGPGWPGCWFMLVPRITALLRAEFGRALGQPIPNLV